MWRLDSEFSFTAALQGRIQAGQFPFLGKSFQFARISEKKNPVHTKKFKTPSPTGYAP